MFVDKVTITLKAGNGGNGGLSFRHEKFKAKGGPDGGDGGNGGSIILRASRNENTLADFRYNKLLKAADGSPGTKSKRHGKSATDLVVNVPVGTVVSKSGETIADLDIDGAEAIIAKGGAGGYGNAHFVSSTRQAPRIAEKGEQGEEMEVSLELKLIADVGIIGLPNAGKSTLLSVLSKAKPAIADYPFTTLHPNLGVVDIDKKTSVLFADIPGLIEGASQGRGLGDEFLRHVERTSVLLHLVDAYTHDIPAAYGTIIKELNDYSSDLAKRPQIVALTKIDGLPEKELHLAINTLKKIVAKKTAVFAISSISGQGVKELLRETAKLVAQHKKAVAKAEKEKPIPVLGLKVNENDWRVEKNKKGFLVTGIKIEKFASRTRFDDFHGEQRFRDIMRKMGVTAELEKQGLEPGQSIQIGNPKVETFKY